MLYLGLRSSRAYLEALDEIRETAAGAHLLSVVGGGAFLHALSRNTCSLTLVDTDADALEHWALVRSLLLAADSLPDFVRLLSGFESGGEVTDPERFLLRPVDLSDRLAGLLEPRLLTLYRRTYGALTVDPVRALGRLGDLTVRFLGFDLAPGTFCWRLGSGAFRDAASFAVVQEALRRLPQRVLQGRFERLDYGALPVAPGEPTIFLASNCESPLFTRGDRILHRVLETAHGELRYVSWHRDLEIGDRARGGESPEDVLAREPSLPAQVLHLAGDRPLPGPLRAVREEISHHSIAEVLARTEYGAPLLVVDGGRRRPVLKLIAAVAPGYKRVLWLPARAGTLERLSGRLGSSYDLVASERSGVLSFTLRGLRREPGLAV